MQLAFPLVCLLDALEVLGVDKDHRAPLAGVVGTPPTVVIVLPLALCGISHGAAGVVGAVAALKDVYVRHPSRVTGIRRPPVPAPRRCGQSAALRAMCRGKRS